MKLLISFRLNLKPISYGLDNKTSFSYPKGYYFVSMDALTGCAEAEADIPSSGPMYPDICTKVQLGL